MKICLRDALSASDLSQPCVRPLLFLRSVARIKKCLKVSTFAEIAFLPQTAQFISSVAAKMVREIQVTIGLTRKKAT